jgi:hypothetical protein
LATAYRSSSYLEKTTEQIIEMKNMVSWAPVTTGNESTPDRDESFSRLFNEPTG